MSLQKVDQEEKNYKRKLAKYVKKIMDACNKESIKRRQIEDRRTRDIEEENDEDMELIREEFLLPEGLLEEIDMY